MSISAALVKELRDACGAGMMDCKMALTEAEGDMDEALKILRRRAWPCRQEGGQGRQRGPGRLLHPPGRDQVGVLVEVNCETDFVARNEDFRLRARRGHAYRGGLPQLGVPRGHPGGRRGGRDGDLRRPGPGDRQAGNVLAKIAEGKLNKWYERGRAAGAALRQGSGEDHRDLRREIIAKIGENIEIRRFARFQLGEGGLEEARRLYRGPRGAAAPPRG